MSGMISSAFPLTDLLQHYAQMGRTGCFELTGRDDFGKICLTVGVVTHAETSSQVGKGAFFEMLKWKAAPYKWSDGPDHNPSTMNEQVSDLLIQLIHAENSLKSEQAAGSDVSLPATPIVTRETRVLQQPDGIGMSLFISSKEVSSYRVPILSLQITLGRGPDNDICIPDSSVSRNHAILCVSGDCVLVRDLGSTNGTSINDQSVTQGILQDGDTLKMGDVTCIFNLGTSASAPAA